MCLFFLQEEFQTDAIITKNPLSENHVTKYRCHLSPKNSCEKPVTIITFQNKAKHMTITQNYVKQLYWLQMINNQALKKMRSHKTTVCSIYYRLATLKTNSIICFGIYCYKFQIKQELFFPIPYTSTYQQTVIHSCILAILVGKCICQLDYMYTVVYLLGCPFQIHDPGWITVLK